MINTNKITKNISNNIVITPKIISIDIFKTLKRKQINTILDLGSYRGDLTKPFKSKKGTKIIGIDITDEYKQNFDYFIHKDFLETTKKDFKDFKIDCIITNPPFTTNKKTNNPYPLDFLNKIFDIFGKNIPINILKV